MLLDRATGRSTGPDQLGTFSINLLSGPLVDRDGRQRGARRGTRGWPIFRATVAPLLSVGRTLNLSRSLRFTLLRVNFAPDVSPLSALSAVKLASPMFCGYFARSGTTCTVNRVAMYGSNQ
jgi:hypothetical protein